MTWIAAAIAGTAAVGTGTMAAVSANKANKRLPGTPDFQSYGGYKPPEFLNLRPVEKQVTDILMKRSQGQDVGFDPSRREKLLENFNITQGRDLETKKADINNQLSGTGLSRNLAARDEMLGRTLQEAGREKNLYTNRVDVEDLEAARSDKNSYTDALQRWGQFGFGQENKRAEFDLGVYNAEQGNRYKTFDAGLEREKMYEDPWDAGISTGLNTFSTFGGMGGSGGGSGGGLSGFDSDKLARSLNEQAQLTNPNGISGLGLGTDELNKWRKQGMAYRLTGV